MPTAKVLVARATGTNGRALIDTLVAKGVRALACNIESARATLPNNIDLVQPNTVALFRNFYDAARHAGASDVVKFLGLGAEEGSPSEVIRQHAASDADRRASGLPYTILRPNSFHQNKLWQASGIASTCQFARDTEDAERLLGRAPIFLRDSVTDHKVAFMA